MRSSARVFVSATSADLVSVRNLVKDALLALDFHPVEQTTFPPDWRTVEDMLTERINSCQAVIHIVGLRYGAEPSPEQVPPDRPRRSFTQLEYDIARKLGKKVYVFLCPESFPFDECEPESDELQQLQQAHRGTILADPHLRNEVATPDDVRLRVRELQIELDELRSQVKRGARSVLLGVAALVLVLGGVVWGVSQLGGDVQNVADQVQDVAGQVTDVGGGVASVGENVAQLEKTVHAASQETIAEIRRLYEDPDVMVGKLKSHIRRKADEHIAKLRSDAANWRKIDEIEKQRDRQLKDVEEVVASIRTGLSGDPDPIFAEAARLLAEQGVDEALAYLQAKQPAIESRVKATRVRRDEAVQEFHAALEPWLLEAGLLRQNLSWEEAHERYEQVAAEAPQWSRARRELGELLAGLAEYAVAEPHLEAALDCAETMINAHRQPTRWGCSNSTKHATPRPSH